MTKQTNNTPASISNRAMRRLVLEEQALSEAPTSPFDKVKLQALVEQLAYVQVDSINVVERAHHMILFSRNRNYKREMLYDLIEEEGSLFEHWTHDACIVPSSMFKHWQHRFDAASKRLREPRWSRRLGTKPNQVLNAVRKRIDAEGPLRTRDFENAAGVKRGSWWGWTQEKAALEYLWRTGEFGIARREGFQKVYDRMENIVPAHHRDQKVDWEESVDWKCRAALKRMGAATAVELAGFWHTFSTSTARKWLEKETTTGGLVQVATKTADGSTPRIRFALTEIFDRVAASQTPSRGMRLVSPFDPVIRDRKRLSWLFGFDYRIEVFVPAAKREYGYYVLPILEGDRFTGRIDLKAHRKEGALEVLGLWWEPGIKASAARITSLRQNLLRLAAFVGVEELRGFDKPKPKR
jgi:uncharacterized protein YcaQ